MADLDTEPHNCRALLRQIVLDIVGAVPNVQLKRSVSHLQADRDTLVTLFGGSEPEYERDVAGRARAREGARQEFEVLGFLQTEADTCDGPVSLVAAAQDQYLDDIRRALHGYEGGETFHGDGYLVHTGPIELTGFTAVIDDEGSTAYAGVEGVLIYVQQWGI